MYSIFLQKNINRHWCGKWWGRMVVWVCVCVRLRVCVLMRVVLWVHVCVCVCLCMHVSERDWESPGWETCWRGEIYFLRLIFFYKEHLFFFLIYKDKREIYTGFFSFMFETVTLSNAVRKRILNISCTVYLIIKRKKTGIEHFSRLLQINIYSQRVGNKRWGQAERPVTVSLSNINFALFTTRVRPPQTDDGQVRSGSVVNLLDLVYGHEEAGKGKEHSVT